MLSAFQTVAFRWSRCRREGQAANTSWPAPCAWRPPSSWAAAGVPACVPGRASVAVAGGTSPVRLESQGWGLFSRLGIHNRQRQTNKQTMFTPVHVKGGTVSFSLFDAVLSEDGSLWWPDRADGVWLGVPVPAETCHQFQNPPGPCGADGLHSAASQKQQHAVSKPADTRYNHETRSRWHLIIRTL